jgi:hypothetical protein
MPNLMPNLTRAEAVEGFKSEISRSNDQLRRFSNSFKESPFRAFEYASPSLAAAASLEVFTRALNALEGEGSKATVESLIEFHTDFVFRRARNPQFSTSPINNLMSQYEAVASADLVAMLKGEF